MTTQIRRDPFARTTLVRESALSHCHCEWCGSTRYRNGEPLVNSAGVPILFRYGTENDNGRVNWHRGLFCSLSCHNAFHS